MVAFYVIMNGQVLTFRASLVFIPVAMFFMASLAEAVKLKYVHRLSDKTPLFISSTGRVPRCEVSCTRDRYWESFGRCNDDRCG